MRLWAIPAWAGDFRFGAKDGAVLLTVKDPTGGEQEALKRWAKKAEKKGWISTAGAGILREAAGKESEVTLEGGVSLADAAAEMAKLLNYKRAGVITAFAFEGGEVKVTEALGADRLPSWAKGGTKTATIEKAPEKAVTVSRPSLSCPECPGPGSEKRNMACEVLWEFLDPEQRQEWLRDRAITTFGGLTGHAYRIAARDTREAKQRGRVAFDLDDRVILHNYHLTVPPEEEVLTVKLMLEHRENWLRVYGEVDPIYRARQVFHSPWPFRP